MKVKAIARESRLPKVKIDQSHEDKLTKAHQLKMHRFVKENEGKEKDKLSFLLLFLFFFFVR